MVLCMAVEEAPTAVDVLAVVASFGSLIATLVLGIAVYRLTDKSESDRLERVLREDREARRQTFQHERSLLREERRVEAMAASLNLISSFVVRIYRGQESDRPGELLASALKELFANVAPFHALSRDPKIRPSWSRLSAAVPAFDPNLPDGGIENPAAHFGDLQFLARALEDALISVLYGEGSDDPDLFRRHLA